MYHIVADSGCDIFSLPGVSFATVPLTISTDHVSYRDDDRLDTHEMLTALRAYNGRSYTACPSAEDWLRAFTLQDGTLPEELYIVTLTSSLSGTYNSAVIARDLLLEQHPQIKVLIVDSLSVGPEMRLILEKIAELKQAGRSFEEVSDSIRSYCSHTRLFFAFQSLHNLAQNGRVNKLVAAAAGVLGISVCGTASEKGQIEPLGKTRGDKRVIAEFLHQMKQAGYRGGKVRIAHTENEPLAERLAGAIREQYPTADIVCGPVRGLCTYYCERGGITLGCEVN